MTDFASCVFCGICNGYCPIFRCVSEELHSPRGYLSLAREIIEKDENYYTIYECLLCRECEQACPLNINIAELILEARKRISKNIESKFKKFLDFALKPKLESYDLDGDGRKCLLFAGCFPSLYVNDEIMFAKQILSLLSFSKIQIVRGCCGVFLESIGMEELASKSLNLLTDLIQEVSPDFIVSLCPTCTIKLSSLYNIKTTADIVLEFLKKFEGSIEGLSSTVVYFNCPVDSVNRLAHQIIRMIPGMVVAKTVKGLPCTSLNPLNEEVCVRVLQHLINEFSNEEVQILIASSPVDLYLLRNICNKKIFAVSSLSELALTVTGYFENVESITKP